MLVETIVSRRCLVWSATATLSGAIQWGVLDHAVLAETRAMLEAVGHRAGRVLIDWREIAHVDAEVLLAIAAGACTDARVTVLVPPGLPGILLAGAIAALAPTVVTSREAAIAALADPLADAAVAAAEQGAAELRGGSEAELLDRLRAVLRHELADTTLARCASAVGCSSRTLQRILEARATTFSAELRAARLSAATELLTYTDTKIDAIALRTGFGCASRLSAALRRARCTTASELRARLRRVAVAGACA